MTTTFHFVSLIILVSVATSDSVSTSPQPPYTVVNDSRGAPRLVASGTSLPIVGSFWLHVFQDERKDNQLSLASISVNGTVKTCIANLKGMNFTIDDWHFVKWTLRDNEFLCTVHTADLSSHVTSTPVNFSIDQKSLSNTKYAISPGAGNTEYCVFNFTVRKSLVIDCFRVRKSPAPVNQSCDCPSRPNRPIPSTLLLDNSTDELDEATHSPTHSFSASTPGENDESSTLGDESSSSSGQTFPTPGPFVANVLNSTATTIHPSSKSTSSGTTKLVLRSGASGQNGTSTVSTTSLSTTSVSQLSTTSSPVTTSISSNSCHTGGTKKCKNGGVCVRNSTDSDQYYCYCTADYYGTFCEYAENITSSTVLPLHGSGSTVASSICPDNYCENGGTCRPTIPDSTFGNRIPNFTCICDQGYVGRQCSFVNVCHSENPCENGGDCSVVVPVDESVMNASFQCQCPHGFSGERCENSSDLSSTTGPANAHAGAAGTAAGTGISCSYEQLAQCTHGVVCAMSNESICNCTSKLTGYCYAQSTSSGGSSANLAAILGGVFGGLALIGLIIGSIFLYRGIQRSRRLKGKYNPAKEEMTAAGGQTLNMATVTTAPVS